MESNIRGSAKIQKAVEYWIEKGRRKQLKQAADFTHPSGRSEILIAGMRLLSEQLNDQTVIYFQEITGLVLFFKANSDDEVLARFTCFTEVPERKIPPSKVLSKMIAIRLKRLDDFLENKFRRQIGMHTYYVGEAKRLGNPEPEYPQRIKLPDDGFETLKSLDKCYQTILTEIKLGGHHSTDLKPFDFDKFFDENGPALTDDIVREGWNLFLVGDVFEK